MTQTIDWSALKHDGQTMHEPIFVTHVDRAGATEIVNSFRAQRNLDPYINDFLPEFCLVASDTETKRPIVVCSLNVAVGSLHGVIDDLHADIELSHEIKTIAIDAIVFWCEKSAKEFGLKYLSFYTDNPSVMRHALRHSFEFMPFSYTRYVKKI